MTLEEKQRKIKLIALILMCNFIKVKKQPLKTIDDTIIFGYDCVFWINELRRVQAHIPFKNGGIAIVGDNNKPEKIIFKNGSSIEIP